MLLCDWHFTLLNKNSTDGLLWMYEFRICRLRRLRFEQDND